MKTNTAARKKLFSLVSILLVGILMVQGILSLPLTATAANSTNGKYTNEFVDVADGKLTPSVSYNNRSVIPLGSVGDKSVYTITIPSILDVTNYTKASSSGSPIESVDSAVDGSGNTVLTYNLWYKTDADSSVTLNIVTTLKNDRIYHTMPATITSTLTRNGAAYDSCSLPVQVWLERNGVVNGNVGATVSSSNPAGKIYDTVTNPYEINLTQLNAFSYGGLQITDPVVVLDLTKLTVGGAPITPAQLAAITVTAGGGGTYDPVTGKISWTMSSPLDTTQKPSYSLLIPDGLIPLGTTVALPNGSIHFTGKVNGFTVAPALVSEDTGSLFSAIMQHPGMTHGDVSLGVIPMSNVDAFYIKHDTDDERIGRIMLADAHTVDPGAGVSVELSIPKGLMIQRIQIPQAQAGCYSGQVKVNGVLAGDNTAAPISYSLPSPVKSDGSQTITLTFVGQWKRIDDTCTIPVSAAENPWGNTYDYGIILRGRVNLADITASDGLLGNVSVESITLADSSPFFETFLDNNSFPVRVKDTYSVDFIGQPAHILDASGVDMGQNILLQPKDEFWIEEYGRGHTVFNSASHWGIDDPFITFTLPAGVSFVAGSDGKPIVQGYLGDTSTPPLTPTKIDVVSGNHGEKVVFAYFSGTHVDPTQAFYSRIKLSADKDAPMYNVALPAYAGAATGTYNTFAMAMGTGDAATYGIQTIWAAGNPKSLFDYVPASSYHTPGDVVFVHGGDSAKLNIIIQTAPTVAVRSEVQKPGSDPAEYLSFNPSDLTGAPTFYADEEGTFRVVISNTTDDAVAGRSVGYFLLPKDSSGTTVNWRTVVFGALRTTADSGIEPTEIYYTTKDNPSAVEWAAGHTDPAGDWEPYDPETTDATDITGFKFVFNDMPIGVYRATIPFTPKVVTYPGEYGVAKPGEIKFGFPGLSESEFGITAALSLKKSIVPLVEPAVSADYTHVEYKLEDVPQWWKADVRDDRTPGSKLASVTVEKYANVADATAHRDRLEVSTYTDFENSIIPATSVFAEGDTSIIAMADHDSFFTNADKGYYVISYLSTKDGDLQTNQDEYIPNRQTWVRAIEVSDTTPPQLDDINCVFDEGAAVPDGNGDDWMTYFRSLIVPGTTMGEDISGDPAAFTLSAALAVADGVVNPGVVNFVDTQDDYIPENLKLTPIVAFVPDGDNHAVRGVYSYKIDYSDPAGNAAASKTLTITVNPGQDKPVDPVNPVKPPVSPEPIKPAKPGTISTVSKTSTSPTTADPSARFAWALILLLCSTIVVTSLSVRRREGLL